MVSTNFVRGIRGATTVDEDSAEQVGEAARELLRVIVEQNQLDVASIASVYFTVTGDLSAGFPAAGARQMPGWDLVPMLCAREMEVTGALAKCIRVLMHVNTTLRQDQIKHVYLRGAVNLRPDLA
jgi:chorismate mutase